MSYGSGNGLNSYGTSKVTDYDKWGLGLSNVQTNTVENTSNRYVGGFSNVPVGNSNSGSLGFSRGGFSTTVVTDISNHNIYTSNITSDGLYYDISGNGYWDGSANQFKYYDTSFNKMTHISISHNADYYNYNIWGRMITNFTGKVYFRIICDNLGAIYISDTSFNAPSNGTNSHLSLNLHEGIECPTWSDYNAPYSGYHGNTGTYDVVANKQYFIRILWGELDGGDHLCMWAESDSNRIYFPKLPSISTTIANYPVTNLTNGNILFFSGEPLMSYYAPPGNYFPGETIPICARWYDKVSITTDPSLILHGISHTYKLEAGAGALDGSNNGQGVATASDTSTWSGATDYQPTAAFDNTIVDQHDVWHSTTSPFPHWLSFEFPSEKYITKYKIWMRTNATYLHAPKNWQLLGSSVDNISDFSYNVLSTYTIIDTRSNQTNWQQSSSTSIHDDLSRNEYYVANPGYYKYYVLHITSSSDTANNQVTIAQVAYYSSPVKESVASLDVNNSGNGTNTLHFNYTVGEGENAVDLKVLGISGDINGSDGLPVGNGSGILSNVKILSNTSNVDTSASLLYAKTTAGTYKIGDTISIETGWSEPVTIQEAIFKTINEKKLLASDAALDDQFGRSVAIDGNYALVGARWNDEGGSLAGSAYLYKFSEKNNVVSIDNSYRILASDRAAGDQFGDSVAINGNYALVGAYAKDNYQGSAYLYKFSESGNASFIIDNSLKILASDATQGYWFGVSVAINGSYALVGASRNNHSGYVFAGAAYLYKFSESNNATFTIHTSYRILASDGFQNDYFGHSVAIDGNYAIVGAYKNGNNEGSVYLYKFSEDNTSFTIDNSYQIEASDIAASDNFGVSVAIDGSYALVGAQGNDGDQNNQTNAGAAYLYKFSEDNINSTFTIDNSYLILAADIAAGDNFGYSVAIDGSYALVGAYKNISSTGSAYLYKFSEDNTNATFTIDNSYRIIASDGNTGDEFGLRVAIDGNYTLVGAYKNISSTGSAYLYNIQDGIYDPNLILSNGGIASYVDGSGTNILKYNYTVQRGQNTTDLKVQTIDLRCLQDQSGGAALTLDTPGTKLLAGGLTGLRGTGGLDGSANASSEGSAGLTLPSRWYARKAFSGALSGQMWLAEHTNPAATTFPQWLAFTFPTEKYITKYKIWQRHFDTSGQEPKNWQLLGSSVDNISDFSYNVLSTYTIIDTQSNQTNWPGTTLTSIHDDSSYNEYYVQSPGYYKHYVLHISEGNQTDYLSIGEVAYYGDDYPNNILMPNVNILTDISSINPGTEVQLVSVSAPDKQYTEGNKIPITAIWIKDISYSGDVSLNLSNGMIADISGYGLDYHKNSLVFNYIVGSDSNEPTPNLSVLSYSGNIYDPSAVDISAAQVTGDLGSVKHGVIIRKPDDKTNFVHKASYTTNQLASLSTNDASYGINEEKRPNNVKIDNSYAFVGDHLYDRGTGRILVYELSYNPVDKADNDIVYHKVGVKSGKFVIDNDISNTPYFYAGQRYRFDQSDPSNSSHRILFGYVNNGYDISTNPQYDISYGTPGQSGAYTEFTPKKDGKVFYISCQTHGTDMGSLYNGYYGIKILTREFWNFHSAIYGNSEGAYLGKNIDIDMANNRIIASNGKGSQDLEYLAAGAGALNGTGGLQGDASASSVAGVDNNYLPIEAFDNTNYFSGDCWISDNISLPHWLSFEFPSEKYITKYKIWSRNHNGSWHRPQTWQLLGIRDGVITNIKSNFNYNIDSSYTVIDTRSNQTGWTQPTGGTADITDDINRKEYYVQSPGYYKYYVLHITENDGTDPSYVIIGQLAYYANDYPYGGANIYKLNPYDDTWSIDASNLIGDLSNNNPNMGLYPYGQLGYNGDVAIDSSYAIISTKRDEERLAAGAGALDGTGGLDGSASTDVGGGSWRSNSAPRAFNGTLINQLPTTNSASHDCWHSNSGTLNSGTYTWSSENNLLFEFPTSKYITRYKIWCTNIQYYTPKAWTLRGVKSGVTYIANNSSTYTIIDIQSNQTTWTQATADSDITNDIKRNEYYVDNPGYYKQYVLNVTESKHDHFLIHQVAYYETVFPQGIAYTYELSANGDWLLDGNDGLSDISGPRGGFGASIDVDAKTKRLAIGSTTRNEILFAGAGALGGTGGLDGIASGYSQSINTTNRLFNGSFDGVIDGTMWHSEPTQYQQNSSWGNNFDPNPEIRFEFPTSKYITRYKIWCETGTYMPKAWTLRGVKSGETYDMTDSGTYTIIDTQSNQTTWTQATANSDITNDINRNEYYVANPGYYKQYIIRFTESISNHILIAQTAYYGYENGGEDAVYTYDYRNVTIYLSDNLQFDNSLQILASDGEQSNQFGTSVAIDGNYALVGEPYGNDEGGSNAGCAYLYKFSESGNGLSIDTSYRILASDAGQNHWFGKSVAINGSYALVGAPKNDGNNGSAYLYKFSESGNVLSIDNSYRILLSEPAGGDQFGGSVAINGNYALVGGVYYGIPGKSNVGSAYLYKFSESGIATFTIDNSYRILASNITTDHFFGYTVAINGSYALVGGTGKDNFKGSAYLYKFSESGNASFTIDNSYRILVSNLDSYDQFGASVAIHGNYALVGAFGTDGINNTFSAAGSAYLYKFTENGNASFTIDNSLQILASDISAGDQFGYSVAINGNYALVGANQSDGIHDFVGSAYLYKFSENGNASFTIDISLQIFTSDPDAYNKFGTSVAIDGNYALVGEPYGNYNQNSNVGSAYLYNFRQSDGVDMSGWVFDQSFNNGDASTNLGSGFGSSVVLDASTLIVTAPYLSDYDSTNNEKGAVYVFELSGVSGNWEIDQSFNGDDISYSRFGYGGVALDGSFLLTSDRYGFFGGIENTYVDPDDGHTYKSHTFLSSGTFTVPYNIEVDFLIVAGGGGGGRGQYPGSGVTTDKGGGGGAGGLIYDTNQILSYGQYNVTVGAGGLGDNIITTNHPFNHENYANGKDSRFNGNIAKGGGFGGVMISNTLYAGDGGSGGGARAKNTNGNWTGGDASGGTGVTTLIINSTTPNEVGVFGNDGGGTSENNTKGGGGGGAGQVGSDGSLGGPSYNKGGDGKQYSIRNGTLVYYAGGGGGGEVGAAGGAGGGGAGSSEVSAQVSTAYGAKHGTDNTGGGGGGAYGNWNYFGGNGGSGIVVIRYKIQSHTGARSYIYERLSNSNGDTSFNFDLSFNSPIDTNLSNFGNSLALKGNNAIFSDGQNTVFYKNYSFGIIPYYLDASAAYDPIPGRTLPGTPDPSYIYYIGDVLDIYMRWSNPVFVRGTGLSNEFGSYEKAYLNLSNDASALYYSGSGTDTLIFRYNVGVHNDLYTNDLSINSYDVSGVLGGSIISSTDNAAEQPYSNDGNWGKFTNRVIIDTNSLALVAIDYVPNTYLIGEVIDISLTFSKIVYTSGDDSSLNLSGDISAAYEAGSESDTITYRYTVIGTYGQGDPSHNTGPRDISDQVDISLVSTTGKGTGSGQNKGITTVAGNYNYTNLPISFLKQNLTGLNIDAIRPGFRYFNTTSTSTSTAENLSTGGGIYKVGDVIDISGTWSEDLSCVVTPNYGVNDKRDVSSGSAYLNLSNDASAIAVSLDVSTILFKYIVTDGCGNDLKPSNDINGIKADSYGGSITDLSGNNARGSEVSSYNIPFLNISTSKTGSPYLRLSDDVYGAVFVDMSGPKFVDISYQPLTNTAADPSYVYGIGDTIDISLTFDELVWGKHLTLITRDASLCLSNDASAQLITSSETKILTFRYTIQEGDTDSSATDLSIIAIDGSICDIARLDFSYINNTSGSIYPLDSSSVLKNVRVKGTRTMDFLDISYTPRDVSFNFYRIGDNIDISLVFNEQVWGYDVSLLLSNDASAEFIDGSGTNVLKFRYTVQEGHKDSSATDLSIVAIDGSICDIGKNDLSYIYQVPDDNGVSIQLLMDASSDLSGVRVDANRPTLSDVSYVSQSTIPKYYGIGDNIDISLTFSENIWCDRVNHGVVSDASLLLSNDASAQLIAGSGTNILTFRYTVQEGDKGSPAVDLSIIAYDGCLCDVGGNEIVKTNTFDVINIHTIGDKIRLDANYPQVIDISYIQATYAIGQNIDISLIFNENVYSSNASLNLYNNATAQLIDGSGTNILTFRYTVEDGDGNHLINNDISIVSLNEEIHDVAENMFINTSFPYNTNNFIHPNNLKKYGTIDICDNLPISYYDVSIGTYGKNSSPQTQGNTHGNSFIDISVNFNESVYITNRDPSLTLSNDASATYISGSDDKTTLLFRYYLKDDTSHNDTINLSVTNVDICGVDSCLNTVNGKPIRHITNYLNSSLGEIIIDHTPPTIVDICYRQLIFNKDNPSIVDISINFTEPVWSTNDVSLCLSNGASAEFIDGNGTNILTFRYTVQDNNYEETSDLSITDIDGSINDLAVNYLNMFQSDGTSILDTSGQMPGVIIIPNGIAVITGGVIQYSTPNKKHTMNNNSYNYYGIDDIFTVKLKFNKDISYADPSLIFNNDGSGEFIGYDTSDPDPSSTMLFKYLITSSSTNEYDLRIVGYDGSINSATTTIDTLPKENGQGFYWSSRTFNNEPINNEIQTIYIDSRYAELIKLDCSASTYYIGEFVDISFILNDKVIVTNSQHLKLILNTKNTKTDLSCVADYVTGNDTSCILFRYIPRDHDLNLITGNFNLQVDDISYGPNFDASIVDFAYNKFIEPSFSYNSSSYNGTDPSLIEVKINTISPRFVGIDVSAGNHRGTYKPNENVYITTIWNRPIDICNILADEGKIKLELSNYLTSDPDEINAEREKATFFAKGKWLGGNNYSTGNPSANEIQDQIEDNSYSLIFKYTLPPIISTKSAKTVAGIKTYYRDEDDKNIKIIKFIPNNAIYDYSFNVNIAEQIFIDCNAGFPIYIPSKQEIAQTSTSQQARPGLRNVPRWDRFGNCTCANIAFNNVKGATSSSQSAKTTASANMKGGAGGRR